MTSSFQTLAMAKAPIAAWPLEAGSGTDISGNGNNLSAVGTPGTTGVPLVAGGGASSTFNGSSSGFSIANQAGWTALGLKPTTGAFTMFAWVAPASLQQVNMFGKMTYWDFWSKSNGQIGLSGGPGGNPAMLYAPVTASGSAWTSPYPYLIGLIFDPAAGEAIVTINGRYSYAKPLTTMGDTGSNHIFVAAAVDGGSSWFSGAIGHFYIYNRALTLGEMAELFNVGYVATPPAFTDVWDQMTVPILGAGSKTLNSNGVYQGAVTKQGSPLVTVTGASTPGDAISGYCSRCGGRIQKNEAQIIHTIGTGAGLNGIGNRQPIHRGCKRIAPVGDPIYTSSNPPTTYRQFCDAYARTALDTIQSYAIRHAPNKAVYMRINGANLSSSFAGLFNTNALALRDYFRLAYTCATIHSYYRMPRNYWTRRLAELIVDQFISQIQVPKTPAGSSSALYSYNTIDLGGSGAVLWYNMNSTGVVPGNAYSAQEDFYISLLGGILWLLSPWLGKDKYATWRQAFLNLVDWYIGPVSNLTTYINPNRNLGVLLGLWIAHKITGDPAYLQAYEQQWTFMLTPPTFPGSTTSIQQQYPDWWNLVQKRWPGATFFSYNSYPTTTGFGWVQSISSVLSDGSDGAGYFPEFNGGGTAPNGGTLPAFDGDYSTAQLDHLIELWCWTKDARFLQYSNYIMNSLLPLIDQSGGSIVYRIPAVGSALGPATTVASSISSGVTVIPCNLTSGMAFTAGQPIVVGSGANAETLTIASSG